MNLDEYELFDLAMKQPGDSTYEHTGIGMAPTWDTESTSGLHPMNVIQQNCVRELTFNKGLLYLPFHTFIIYEILARMWAMSKKQVHGDVDTGLTRPPVHIIKLYSLQTVSRRSRLPILEPTFPCITFNPPNFPMKANSQAKRACSWNA